MQHLKTWIEGKQVPRAKGKQAGGRGEGGGWVWTANWDGDGFELAMPMFCFKPADVHCFATGIPCSAIGTVPILSHIQTCRLAQAGNWCADVCHIQTCGVLQAGTSTANAANATTW